MPLFLIFLFLAAMVVLVSYRFSWAVVCVCALLPLYLVRCTVMSIPTNLFEMSVVLIWVVGLLQPPIRQQFLSFWQTVSPFLQWSVVLFILASTISIGISPTFLPLTQSDVLHSLGIWKSWIIVPLLLAWCVGSVGITNRLFIDRILKALLFSGVVVALLGLLQNPFAGRITSVYDVPNSLALFLVPLTIIAVWKKWWYVGFIFLGAILATQSLMAVVSLSVACFLGVVLYRPVIINTRMKILGSLGIVLIIGLLVYRLPYFIEPFITPEAHSSLSVRLQLWRIAGRLVMEHPILGIGLGRFEPAYQVLLHEDFSDSMHGIRATQPFPEFVFRDPHNVFLSFWLNTGLLGLVSFIVVNVGVLYTALRYRGVAPGLLLAVICLGVFGLADTIYWKNDLAALQWALLTLIFIETYTAYRRNFGSST